MQCPFLASALTILKHNPSAIIMQDSRAPWIFPGWPISLSGALVFRAFPAFLFHPIGKHHLLNESSFRQLIKWVDPANIHITLAFLGDIEEERIKAASMVLSKICSDCSRFSFHISGTGLFISYQNPRIIWAGIDNAGELSGINDLIVRGLRDTGFNLEERPFRPHITLGRIKYVKDKSLLRETLDRYSDTDFQDVDVREVILFESILRPEGPLYKQSGVFRLRL